MDMEVVLYILGIFAVFIVVLIDAVIAGFFYEAAKEKGYPHMKYFWLCFLTSFAGYLLVIALPDRGNTQQALSDELPDL